MLTHKLKYSFSCNEDLLDISIFSLFLIDFQQYITFFRRYQKILGF